MGVSNRAYVPLLLIGLGMILFLNPLYAFSGEASSEHRYEVEAIEDDERAIGMSL